MRADHELAQLAALGASLCAWDEAAYPASLRAIADPPLVLAVLGTLASDAGAVAIVGARRASGYGRRVAEELAHGLAAVGLTVVSGLATGIDAAAHSGALAAGGRTVAVLAHGHRPRLSALACGAVPPRSAASGALVSEFPCGTAPLPLPFPAPQSPDQRADARHRGGRGGAAERVADHRALRARAGARGVRRSRDPSAWPLHDGPQPPDPGRREAGPRRPRTSSTRSRRQLRAGAIASAGAGVAVLSPLESRVLDAMRAGDAHVDEVIRRAGAGAGRGPRDAAGPRAARRRGAAARHALPARGRPDAMAKHLVIVESPAKAKTLGKYLGRDYQVKASVGHVVDLPKSKLGVDIENDFKPEYHVIHGKTKVLERDQGRRRRTRTTSTSRPTPIARARRSPGTSPRSSAPKRKNVRRVLFNEITKKAVQEAIQHPRDLDQNRFDAQQARRVLDRLVGYQLSPLLWKKVRRGLSAGRVQSVAVRIIVEREREIRAFVPEEYWTVEARLEAGQPPPFVRPAGRGRRQEGRSQGASGSRPRRASTRSSRGLDRRGVDRHQGREEGAPPPPDAALHHLAPAAGGVAQARLPAVAHDAHRAAALRGRRAGRRGRGRSHHLHAHRLDSRLGRGDRRGARVHRRSATAPTTCRRSRTSTARRRTPRTPTKRSGPTSMRVGSRAGRAASSSARSSRSTR